MSGVYNNWIKVLYPNMPNDIVQMKSGGFQPPFYFGGSQVPLYINSNANQISGGAIVSNRVVNPKIQLPTVNRSKLITPVNRRI